MRTNIVLKDELVNEAMKYTNAKSKTALVEQALKSFITTKATERRRENYQQRVHQLQEKLASVTLRESSVDLIRRDRER